MPDILAPNEMLEHAARHVHKPSLPGVTLALLLLLFAIPAAAQDDDCLQIWEVWSDYTRHEVHVGSGKVVSYTIPVPASPQAETALSPDGHFTAVVGWDGSNQLELTDNRVGVSVMLAEAATSVRWSPDSQWLAYIQSLSDRTRLALNLFSIDSGETISVVLMDDMPSPRGTLEWSPDGSLIAAGVLSQVAPEAWDIHVYTAPDLKRKQDIRTTLTAPELRWSPAGRTLLAYGPGAEAFLIDRNSAQATVVPVDGYGIYQLHWSPDETYLLISHAYNDWLDVFDVVTTQGEFVLEDVVVDTNYDASQSRVDWVSDHLIIASTQQQDTGFSDLTLFDLSGAEQHILQPLLSSYRLSPDRRYAAVAAQERPDAIQFFDLSLERPAVFRTVTGERAFSNFVWRAEGTELLVLFEDRALRGYDPTADSWREITTIPGEERMMEHVACGH